MLSKLIKYDFKALLGKSLLLIAAIIVCAVGSTLCFNGLLNLVNSTQYEESTPAVFGVIILFFGAIGLILLMAIACALVQILIAVRYYKHLMSDEGYLTFTLPVTTSNILLSKVITGSVISGLANIATLGGYFLIFGSIFGNALNMGGIDLSTMWSELMYYGDVEVDALYMALIIVLIVLNAIVAIIYGILTIYTAITFGSTYAKQHKVMGSILAYIIIYMAVSTLSAPMSVFAVGDTYVTLIITLAGTLVINIALSAAFWLVSNNLLKNKLNLR